MTNKILFRCDSSAFIGSGHLMRCRNLAGCLKSRGASIYFSCRDHPGALTHLLAGEFYTLKLKAPIKTPALTHKDSSLSASQKYSEMLGCSQIEDACETLNLIRLYLHAAPHWIIVDHYTLDIEWERFVVSNLFDIYGVKSSILCIDDLANRHHFADILLDQNYYGDGKIDIYNSLTRLSCSQFLGPHYSLLDPKYSTISRQSSRSKKQTILIYFGAVDSHNCTTLALTALAQQQFRHLSLLVVLGIQNSRSAQIRELATLMPNVEVFDHVESLGDLIAKADLGIGAGGTTTWERLCLNLQTILISLSENQLSNCIHLSQDAYIHYLGMADTVRSVDLSNAVSSWMNNELSFVSGQYLVDAYGSHRIATRILGLSRPLSLRMINLKDEGVLFRWANDETVRANSFSPNPITPNTHKKWFLSGFSNRNRVHFILEDSYTCPLAQIRFDFDPSANSIYIDISVDRCARGLGLGTELLLLGLERVHQLWGPNLVFIADILNENISSITCFKRAGFTIDQMSVNSSYVRLKLTT